MKLLEVFIIVQNLKLKCELLDSFKEEDSNLDIVIVLCPFNDKDNDLPIVIPLAFDPSLPEQKGKYVDNEKTKRVINKKIKHDHCTLVFEPIDNSYFEIRLSDVDEEELQDSSFHAEQLNRFEHVLSETIVDKLSESDAFRKKRIIKKAESKIDERITNTEKIDIPGLITELLELEIEAIPIDYFDRIPEDSLSQDDSELLSSFKKLIQALGQTNINKQDITAVLTEIVQNSYCKSHNKLFLTIVSHKSLLKILSREERDELFHSVVLSNIDCFNATVIERSADYYYYRKDFANSLILFQEILNRIKENNEHVEDYPETLNSIGCCYIELLQFEKAYEAFSMAIKERESFPAAQNNWAFALYIESETASNNSRKKKLLKDALAHIDEAIKLYSEDDSYYTNRAFIEYDLGDYDGVINDRSKAQKMSQEYADYRAILKLSIDARIKKAIDEKKENNIQFSDFKSDLELIYKNEPNQSKYYFEALRVYYNAPDNENKKNLKELLRYLLLFEFHIGEILYMISLLDPKQDIYYYTRTSSLKHVLTDLDETVKYRLPLFHVNHMNDPREGKEFESVLSKHDPSGVILDNSIFSNNDQYHSRRKLATDFVFLKAFTKNEDSLPMWIHYADSGKGCCVKVSRTFFTNFISDHTENHKSFITNQFDKDYNLYTVLYVKDGKLVQPAPKTIKAKIIHENYEMFIEYFSKISTLYPKLDNKTQSLVSEAIKKTTNRLRYLIKSSDYSYEQEMRIVVSRPITDLKHFSSDIKTIPSSGDNPIPKVCVFTEKSVPIEEIILGPKIVETDEIIPFLEKALLELNNYDKERVIITKSAIEYR